MYFAKVHSSLEHKHENFVKKRTNEIKYIP
jgi:hypothetical protein